MGCGVQTHACPCHPSAARNAARVCHMGLAGRVGSGTPGKWGCTAVEWPLASYPLEGLALGPGTPHSCSHVPSAGPGASQALTNPRRKPSALHILSTPPTTLPSRCTDHFAVPTSPADSVGPGWGLARGLTAPRWLYWMLGTTDRDLRSKVSGPHATLGIRLTWLPWSPNHRNNQSYLQIVFALGQPPFLWNLQERCRRSTGAFQG